MEGTRMKEAVVLNFHISFEEDVESIFLFLFIFFMVDLFYFGSWHVFYLIEIVVKYKNGIKLFLVGGWYRASKINGWFPDRCGSLTKGAS